MPDAHLEKLSDDELIEFGAALETELGEIRAAHAAMAARAVENRLLKPGVKLGINTVVAVAGLALAPMTLNLSLCLTALGAGMTMWDGLDFSRDANDLLRLRFQTRALHRRAEAVQAMLAEIEELLTSRLGPP